MRTSRFLSTLSEHLRNHNISSCFCKRKGLQVALLLFGEKAQRTPALPFKPPSKQQLNCIVQMNKSAPCCSRARAEGRSLYAKLQLCCSIFNVCAVMRGICCVTHSWVCSPKKPSPGKRLKAGINTGANSVTALLGERDREQHRAQADSLTATTENRLCFLCVCGNYKTNTK